MPTRTRRRYPDEFRASALATLDANGGNLDRTARQLNVPRKTLAGWAGGQNNPVVAELRHQKKADLVGDLTQFVSALCGVRPDQVKDLNFKDAAVAMGIAVDKLLLLQEQQSRHARAEESAPAVNLGLLDAEELEVLSELLRKARGIPPLAHASDLDHPCVVDPDHPDGGYWPNGKPPDNPPDDPLGEHRKRVRHGLHRNRPRPAVAGALPSMEAATT